MLKYKLSAILNCKMITIILCIVGLIKLFKMECDTLWKFKHSTEFEPVSTRVLTINNLADSIVFLSRFLRVHRIICYNWLLNIDIWSWKVKPLKNFTLINSFEKLYEPRFGASKFYHQQTVHCWLKDRKL